MDALHKYMTRNGKDIREVVLLGDVMDFDLISHHNRDNLRATQSKRIDKEYEYAGDQLDILRGLAPNAKFTLIEGNHDERIERYIDANPALEGSLELQTGLQLIQRKIRFVRFWSKGEVYKIGKATFIHGLYTTQYHARKHVEAYGTNIFYGHTHDVQSFSKELHGKDKTIVGQSLGCLCKYDQRYMRGKPSKWQQAFGVFHFLPDGHFSYNVVRIFKHRFVGPDGVVYEG
jgi:predicted phosphodiesterase